ncbi:MAG TPA: PhzF family phenazine biosynthesis protein [Acidimicrobiales bacterium]|nr:PhzF family phenazine biosynthesis protein [Acidimicrobiales bacterium]
MGTDLRYRIVDVFSDRPLAGNGLCVVLDPAPESVMQALAREVNLSETTYPTVTSGAAYDVRIFTPNEELPFAGHPSLGTAWVLGENAWTQRSPGATVTVTADAAGAVMTQPDPQFVDLDGVEVVAALGLPGADAVVQASAAGNTFVFALTEAPIEAIDPDLSRLMAAGAGMVGAVRRRDDANLHVRVFAPGAGIAEDPGTGSAAGPIGLLARQRWGTDADVTILQGAEVGRPCVIEVHAEEGALRVGGRVAACAEGRFSL